MTFRKILLILTFLFPLYLFAWQEEQESLPDVESYVNDPGIYDLDSLQGLVDWLDAQSLETRDYLEKVYESHFRENPIDATNSTKLRKEVDLGTALMNAEDMNFQILGDMLLQAVSDTIQNGLNTEFLNKRDAELLVVIDKLKAVQYGVNIPVSDREKLEKNLREGNFSYVFTRLRTRCVLDCSNGFCDPMCKWFWAVVAVGIVFLFLLIVFRKKIRLRSRLKGLTRS